MGEFPLLKSLLRKYTESGLTLVSISLDDDVQAMNALLAREGIEWMQIRVGKDGELASLFNVKGTPSYYVLDRDLRIAAKNVLGKDLETVVGRIIGVRR